MTTRKVIAGLAIYCGTIYAGYRIAAAYEKHDQPILTENPPNTISNRDNYRDCMKCRWNHRDDYHYGSQKHCQKCRQGHCPHKG